MVTLRGSGSEDGRVELTYGGITYGELTYGDFKG